MIRTVDLRKSYGSFVAVAGINLNIQPGEIYGFLGPNGAGKTSTIMMLLGITRPTSGEIYLFNERYTPARLDLRRRIGVVPEKHPQGVWSWMTAVEYLRLFAGIFRVERPEMRISFLLEQVGLDGVRNKRMKEFSRGMMQKLSIIRSLLPDPDLLFLDEPISGLDPLGIKQIRDLILSENRDGRTIFISSHLLSEMEKICRRVAIIYRGRLMAEDHMGALLSRLTKDREVTIELDAIPEGLAGRLRAQLPFVLESRAEGNILSIRIPKEGDFRRRISEYLIKQDQVPLRIQEKTVTLEDAFVTITGENIDMLTRDQDSI